ncbi:MAG: PTS sugar transporter subunit IIA [Rubrobacteraceae bacterium]
MSEILKPGSIELGASLASQKEAIQRAGDLLVENGHVEDRYIDSMFEREESVSTYMGNDVAIPHGTNDSKQWVTKSGLSIITVPDGVEYGDGNVARLIVGIAGKGDEHLEILSKIALVVSEEENVEKIVNSKTKEELLSYFEEVEEVG